MGLLISSVFANWVMEDLEMDCLQKVKKLHNYSPFFYFSYALLCVRKDMVGIICKAFNNFEKYLKFANQIESIYSLSFLDISTIKKRGKLVTNWDRKSSSSDCALYFNSNYSIYLKRNIIFHLLYRSMLLSHKKFHSQNIEIIKNILICNNYESKFIEKCIRRRKFGAAMEKPRMVMVATI